MLKRFHVGLIGLLVGFGGLSLGLFCLIIGRIWSYPKPVEVPYIPPPVHRAYILSTRRIAEGETIASSDVELIHGKGAHYQDSFEDLKTVIGKKVVHVIPLGQMVCPYHLGAVSDLSETTKEQ